MRLSPLAKARDLEQENRGLVNDSPATATCSVGRIGNELQGHTLRSGSVSLSIFIHLHLASLSLPLPFLSSLETLVERSSSPCRNSILSFWCTTLRLPAGAMVPLRPGR